MFLVYSCIVGEIVDVLFFIECYDGCCSTVCKMTRVRDRTLFSDVIVQNRARVVCEQLWEECGAEQEYDQQGLRLVSFAWHNAATTEKPSSERVDTREIK